LSAVTAKAELFVPPRVVRRTPVTEALLFFRVRVTFVLASIGLLAELVAVNASDPMPVPVNFTEELLLPLETVTVDESEPTVVGANAILIVQELPPVSLKVPSVVAAIRVAHES
jgi:hypothetical protein